MTLTKPEPASNNRLPLTSLERSTAGAGAGSAGSVPGSGAWLGVISAGVMKERKHHQNNVNRTTGRTTVLPRDPGNS